MGGGVMRTAAKAAALGGYRSAPWKEQAAAAASRRASRPGPPTVSTAHAGEAAPQTPVSMISSAQNLPVDAPAVQRPSWELDDWEFAGGKEEEQPLDALHPAPRLVFGPVPTLEEAKEATSDLKEALDKLYFSPAVAGYEGSTITQKSASSESTCFESLEVRNGCAAILPSAPKHVIQAFSLLQGSPEAQNVVASLASDQNVWDAVMKNEKVMEFYKTHQLNVLPSETTVPSEDSVAEIVDSGSPKNVGNDVGDKPSENSGNGFRDFMHTIKLKVTQMVNNLSDFFQDFIGTSTGANCSTATKTATNDSYVEVAVGASFIALAIAAILVVLLKRG